jgi:hypothetical protein
MRISAASTQRALVEVQRRAATIDHLGPSAIRLSYRRHPRRLRARKLASSRGAARVAGGRVPAASGRVVAGARLTRMANLYRESARDGEPIEQALECVSGERGLEVLAARPGKVEEALAHRGGEVSNLAAVARHELASR